MTAVTPLDELVEREFAPLLGERVAYLNSAATGPLPSRTLKVIAEEARLRAEPWRYGPELQFATLDRSRELAARLVNGRPEEIVLTVNTSFGINLAARSLPLEPGDVVVGSDRDFPANVYPWMSLERSRGVIYRQVPAPNRLFDEDALIAALDEPRVKVLAISWVSFESGARLDLERLGRACRERGIYLVLDAIQGLGVLQLDVRTTPVDIVSCGAQKWLCAPWGTGFTWVRRELVETLEPTFTGWMSVEGSEDFTKMLDYSLKYRRDGRRFELCTLPYQDFAAFNASLEVLLEAGKDAIEERVSDLTQLIVDWADGTESARLVTHSERGRRSGVMAVVPRDASAASSRLNAAGVVHSLREGAIRLSPHFFTPRAHVVRALELLG